MNQSKQINEIDLHWQICFDSMRCEGTRRARLHASGWCRAINTMVSTRAATGKRPVRQNYRDRWAERFSREANKANAPPREPWSKQLSRMIDSWYFRPKPTRKAKRKVKDWPQSLKRMALSGRKSLKPQSQWDKRIHNWARIAAKRKPSYARPRHPQKEAWSKCFGRMIQLSHMNSLSNWEIRLNEFARHANRKLEDHNKRTAKANRKAELQVRDNRPGTNAGYSPA